MHKISRGTAEGAPSSGSGEWGVGWGDGGWGGGPARAMQVLGGQRGTFQMGRWSSDGFPELRGVGAEGKAGGAAFMRGLGEPSALWMPRCQSVTQRGKERHLSPPLPRKHAEASLRSHPGLQQSSAVTSVLPRKRPLVEGAGALKWIRGRSRARLGKDSKTNTPWVGSSRDQGPPIRR